MVGEVIFWAIVAFAEAFLVGVSAFSAGRDVERGANKARNVASTEWLVQRRDDCKAQRDIYRRMARNLCERRSDCMGCPLEPDKCSSRCELWSFEEEVRTSDFSSRMFCPRSDIDEVTGDGRR